jgi:serine/threonine protein kinase/serine/threonine protein phosphatase PrpC
VSHQLRVTLGRHSDRGRKATNQDRLGARVPDEPARTSKGVAVAIADGISSSTVSQMASEIAVDSFLRDYYLTSDSWSVRTAGKRVLSAINSRLYAETRRSEFRFDKDLGYVCTFSVVIVKSRTAHIFHVGDARVYGVEGDVLVQLTEDHRLRVSAESSYLSRALGPNPSVDIDYITHAVSPGSLFVLATDGVYEHCSAQDMLAAARQHCDDLDSAARAIVAKAFDSGSDDNLSVELLRIDAVPNHDAVELLQSLGRLPFAPELKEGSELDGYRVVRSLYASHRSHVYLAVDVETAQPVALKLPSVEQHHDNDYLERFVLEEWIARRIDSPHVVRPVVRERPKAYLYSATEFVDGQTLGQWMRDHPTPDIETVRHIVEQIARGLQAFHRQEMIHQDLRPDNILIDKDGTAKIIDFGSVTVAGLEELSVGAQHGDILGTAQYTAPEYFLGEPGSPGSDIFSLGVIAYQMVSGRLPYGAQVPKARTRAAQQRLAYRTVLEENREVPAWVDYALRQAVHFDPTKRYTELSEFTFDLRHPNAAFLRRGRPPLIERNPTTFWRRVSFVLGLLVVFLLAKDAYQHSRARALERAQKSRSSARP